MLRSISNFFVSLMQKYMPDPFLLVVILTLLNFILALILTPTPFLKMVDLWYKGLWSILTFTLQMVLILVAGYTLAESKPIKSFLIKISSIPKNQGTAAISIFIVGAIASFINWGLGLIVSAVYAREVAKRVENADFGFLVASAYIGFIVWAGGLSSSIALVSASSGNKMNIIEQFTHQVIPLSETVFAPYNLIGTVLVVIIVAAVLYLMQPKSEQIKVIDKTILEQQGKEMQEAKFIKKENTFASKLEHAWIFNVLIFILGLIYIFKNGLALDINKFIFLMLITSIILHWTPIAYIKTFNNAAKVTGPLILQYPFYGGIMGLMIGTGLAGVIAHWFVAISTNVTLPFWSFISSLIISYFVPSGGGHWVIQAPVMVPAAQILGASQAKVAMGTAYGEQIMNMLQPFWALPILAIANLRARDIMGYCAVAFFVGVIVMGAVLLIAPL
jgi:short-chain fatty acids transporter